MPPSYSYGMRPVCVAITRQRGWKRTMHFRHAQTDKTQSIHRYEYATGCEGDCKVCCCGRGCHLTAHNCYTAAPASTTTAKPTRIWTSYGSVLTAQLRQRPRILFCTFCTFLQFGTCRRPRSQPTCGASCSANPCPTPVTPRIKPTTSNPSRAGPAKSAACRTSVGRATWSTLHF
jgi:hypothetical protein